MAIGSIIRITATVSDFRYFLSGLSQHESELSPTGRLTEQKWEYIVIIQGYIVYFFVRASVMLFVLRILPSYKRWQQKVVMLLFAVNFVVTAYACLMFGISCVPFRANWQAVPDTKCFSKKILTMANQINAALSCACDIATALIPQFLLWNVKMRVKTKRQLNIMFGLGLIIALLSIARAAALIEKALTADTTWSMMPSSYINAFEYHLGILVACGPAIRQFCAYRGRTHTFLPSKQRQCPNQDFEKMRYRITMRDIIWYRKALMLGDRVIDAASIFQRNLHRQMP
ncbi:MAG: hypothetical protein L6R40_006721 [Gallowayella cf. fulva]|nr:MAG: hypothetical protein L6R40_006721 [Xanthomendoza cf. fulva]